MKKQILLAITCFILTGTTSISHATDVKVYNNRNHHHSSDELLGSSKVNVIVKSSLDLKNECTFNSTGCTSGMILGAASASADLKLWKVKRKDIAKVSLENLHKVTPKIYLKNNNQLFYGYTLNKNRISAIARDWNGKIVWDKFFAAGENQEIGTIIHLDTMSQFFNDINDANITSKTALQCFVDQLKEDFPSYLKKSASYWEQPLKLSYYDRFLPSVVGNTLDKCAPSLSRISSSPYHTMVRDAHKTIINPLAISGIKNQKWYAQFSDNSEISDWDINTKLNVKVDYGYTASYNILAYKKFGQIQFTPFINSTFDAKASYGDYSVEGRANPLLNASLDAKFYIQKYEVGGSLVANWRGPQGEVEACYGFWCVDVWDIKSTPKRKHLWSYDED